MTPAPELSPLHAAPVPRWQVRLLGDTVLEDGLGRPLRLPSRAAAALLARLAMAPQRAHAREELIELLWPGVDLPVGRNRLRQVLSTLKSLLEEGAEAPVIVADRMSLRVAPGALDCDVPQFEAACRAGQREQALALYRGELMPGHFDEWIGDERLRLAALADRLVPAVAASTPAAPAPAARTAAAVDATPDSGAAPAYLTRFYGREADSARLRAEVLQHRLVTLVGPGGAGKTRLSAELATALRDAPRLHRPEPGVESPFDAVLFVPLVACNGRAEVLQALAGVLGTEAGPAAIERALAGRRALLVLDNFEHLVEAAADLAQALLARLPHLHLLVTSRRVLGLDGERECVLGTLPPPSGDLSLADAAGNPAVALFVDRARASRGDFQLVRGNLGAVIGLVRALDAMPLALELAAARCRTLAPSAMLHMLGPTPGGPLSADSATPALDLLERRGSRGDRDGRQASMVRVLAWSWQLLPAPAQALLSALTVFRAGCTVSAVAAVCELSPVQVGVQLDLLAGHSLVQVHHVHEQGERPSVPWQSAEPGRASGDMPDRFSLLEVIREFAAARLPAERAATLRSRCRQWLIDWARREAAPPVASRIAPELPNVHAALLGAESDGAAQDAVQLALALRDYWELDGMPPHSQQALAQAVERHGAGWPDALRCDAHELLAYTSIGAGDGPQALAHAEAALALAGDDPLRRGRCLLRRTWVWLSIDDQAEAQAEGQFGHLDDAMALARQVGDAALQARVLHQQGILMRYSRRDLVGAEALFAQSQALWEGLGNQRMARARLRNRAQCRAARGLHREALEIYLACEQAAVAEGDWVGIIDSTHSVASGLDRLRRWDGAVAKGRETIRVSWQRHHAHGLAYALWNIVHPMLRAGQVDVAVQLLAQSAAYWTEHMGPLGKGDQRDVGKLLRLATVQLGAERVDRLWREGAALSIADAVALALGA
ncbi:AAA family ATPase [Ideonella sp. A 288]|uniref:ATP-binding protein n=1 Tax=Ideonella sp. A 288 TaxID=1962181 RepID=UPI000B4BF41F|nr:AAA family ATPase [Ideonella sp. A 288]